MKDNKVRHPCLNISTIPFCLLESKEHYIGTLGPASLRWQSITAMAEYERYSFKELRLTHYEQTSSPSVTSISRPTLFSPLQGTPSSSSSKQESAPTIFRLAQQLSNGSLFAQNFPFQARTALPYIDQSSKFRPTNQMRTGICQWTRDELRACRGTELKGTLNPDVLPILFHKQACK